MLECIFCGKSSRIHHANLHRINPKGEEGVWACDEHIKKTDVVVSEEVKYIINALNPKAQGREGRG